MQLVYLCSRIVDSACELATRYSISMKQRELESQLLRRFDALAGRGLHRAISNPLTILSRGEAPKRAELHFPTKCIFPTPARALFSRYDTLELSRSVRSEMLVPDLRFEIASLLFLFYRNFRQQFQLATHLLDDLST